jgi:hypothetical protein
MLQVNAMRNALVCSISTNVFLTNLFKHNPFLPLSSIQRFQIDLLRTINNRSVHTQGPVVVVYSHKGTLRTPLHTKGPRLYVLADMPIN